MSSTTEIQRTLEGAENASSHGYDAGDAESAAWAAFVAARSLDQFCVSWLTILCSQIERVRGALLLIGGQPDNTYVPAAIWPDPSRDMAYLAPSARGWSKTPSPMPAAQSEERVSPIRSR
jgi:hypothetical protein